ncbi:MAG: hypothetical protein ACRCZI_06635 [Cetobacterium sp.]
MIVMGHPHVIHVEKFATQKQCEDRKAYVKAMTEEYGAVVVMTCETAA